MSLIEKVKNKVEEIIDPEVGLSLGALGLIKNVKEIGEGLIQIDFIATSPYCPLAYSLAKAIRSVAESIEGVKRAYVYLHGHFLSERINADVNR